MKNKDDIEKWLKEGMVQAAVYWYQTYGIPIEFFQDWCNKRFKNKGQQILFIDKLIKQNKICLK
jgi:hypothetical protein